MARWNDGRLDISGNNALSEKNLPQEGSVKVTVDAISYEAKKNRQLAEIRLSRGRFTGNPSVTYVFSDILEKPKERRDFSLPYIDIPGLRMADGGDIRDINALGGGIPGNTLPIGGGTPGRKSVYSKQLNQAIDHQSPVRKI